MRTYIQVRVSHNTSHSQLRNLRYYRRKRFVEARTVIVLVTADHTTGLSDVTRRGCITVRLEQSGTPSQHGHIRSLSLV